MSDEPIIEDIEYSDSATVYRADGTLFSAFQSLSYVARVAFDDGGVVVIAFPVGAAAEGPPGDWADAVAFTARQAHMPGGLIAVDLMTQEG
jgi:hypothetical protein